MKRFVFSLKNIDSIIPDLWSFIESYKTIGFHGEMGVGKTTLIKYLCNYKKVINEVNSPTYSIINEYVFIENNMQKKIYHLDLYRLKNEEDVFDIGLSEILSNKQHYCLIEWPEKAHFILPENMINFKLTLNLKDRKRILEIF